MVRVEVLRGVLASGQRLVAGTIAEISESDARILSMSGKVRVLPPEPKLEPVTAMQSAEAVEERAPESGPMRETSSRGRRRGKATL